MFKSLIMHIHLGFCTFMLWLLSVLALLALLAAPLLVLWLLVCLAAWCVTGVWHWHVPY